MKLQQNTIAELVPPNGQAEAIISDDDTPGLYLRIRASGHRSWLFQYKVARKVKRVPLGDITVVSLARARKAAGDLHARVRLGGDPVEEKAEGIRRSSNTMLPAINAYLADAGDKVRASSLKQKKVHLLKHCAPFHNMELAKIDRRAVSERMKTIKSKSGPTASNRTRSSLAAFYSWAIREGLTDSNPAAGGNEAVERSRDRVLTDDEMKSIWLACDDGSDYSSIVRMLMLTACRADEVGGLRWDEALADALLISGDRTKNGRPLHLPFSPPMRAVLEACPRGSSPYVFGRHFQRWSAAKKALDEKLGDAVAPWTHHDLRRTTATRMADLGIAPHIIEAVINHVSGHKAGVAGIYNRSSYSPQKAFALNTWAAHLLEIVEGRAVENVVALSA
jgi:integrase